MYIQDITLLKAKELYKKAINSMKCNITNAVTFEVEIMGEKKIIKIIPSTKKYTMTERDEWNEDLFTSRETTYKHTILIKDGKALGKEQ